MAAACTLYLLLFYSFVYMCAAPNIGLRPEYCGPGYFGFFCADICPYPYYGKYCDYTCSCGEKYCSHVNGCIHVQGSSCLVGFIGSYCESKCSFPFFGQGCQTKCLCAQEDCHYSTGCQRKLVHRKNPTRLKILPIDEVTTNKKSSTPMQVTTFWTRAQSTETTSEVSLECKTMPPGTGKSSGIFSFIRNKGMKASIVFLCILFILLGIAHILLFIVQRIKVKNNAIPV